MHQHYRILIVFLLCGYLAGSCVGQGDGDDLQPIGAHRVYKKTHFQCAGRPSGYYADVETGCQVYHMCDGLGRQFSYSCPNTTLFQQRMLVCDHWYMVNCSRAESNYDANLLIGQRDKPFVTDLENELRTPRPDLLDRPYAPDYAGESFRNQYKLGPANPNAIHDTDQKKHINRKPEEAFVRPNQPYTFATHWSTQHPSKLLSTVNPTVLTPTINNDLLPPLLAPPQHTDDGDAFASRFAQTHDLAISSSQDSRRSEPESNFINSIPTVRTADRKTLVSFTPSRSQSQFDVEFAHVTQQQLPSTAAATAFTQPLPESTTPTTIQATIDDNTPQSFVRRPTFPKKDTSNFSRGQTKYNNQKHNPDKHNNIAAKSPLGETGRILSRPSNIPEPIVQQVQHAPNAIPLPDIDLLPPFDKIQIYDDATTQGPPIYSQWKIPASGLLPPLFSKFNHLTQAAPTARTPKAVPANSVPISALKRPANGLQPPRFEAPSTEASSTLLLQNSQHNLFRKSNLYQTTPSFPLPTLTPTESSNIVPVDVPAFADHQHHQKSPTPRSVSPTSGAVNVSNLAGNHLHTRDNNYLELKKLLHIPEYTFPLEADTRIRAQYVRDDSVNSFQVRIPAGVNDVDAVDSELSSATATASTATQTTPILLTSTLSSTTVGVDDDFQTTGGTASDNATGRTRRTPWYGENAACPECHPSFVKGSSCEPCVKIRR